MNDVVIVSACRTAIGAFGGTLKDSHAAPLAAVTMAEAVKRAGIPEKVTAVTINWVCTSGMEAMVSGMAMIRDGSFQDEIVPMEITGKKGPPQVFDIDEHFRPGLTLEGLKRLPSVFVPDFGTVTAGNSSGINDGSAGLMIMAADTAKELGCVPLARIRAVGRGGCHPSVMGLSPVPAVRDLLQKRGLKIGDFDLIEINEAFPTTYIACERELGLDREQTNVNGSGIALGHPVGATGARILVTLIHAMKKRGNTLGLSTLCGGGGVSMACAIEMI